MTLTLFAERDARSGLWQYRCLFSGSARYLARREVRSFSDLRGLLRGGRNRREVINCRTSAIEPTNAFCIGPEADSTLSPPTNRISIPCASRDPFLFRLCSIVFTFERPASFQALLCSSARAESNTSSLVLRYYARRLAFFLS